MSVSELDLDPFDVRRVAGVQGLLRDFNHAGVLIAADVHVARRVAQLAGEQDPSVLLASALAVRAPRLGNVYVDLQSISDTASVESEQPIDLAALPWPAPDQWIERVGESALVGVGEQTDSQIHPLRLIGSRLYLDRYWREERGLAQDLCWLSERPGPDYDAELLRGGLSRLFADDSDGRQSLAAGVAVTRRLAVIAGGPGTGKTTTVARIVALLLEQAAGAQAPTPLIALAAPTGKAAARLAEAVHEEAARLELEPSIREQLLALQASTIHRLLGARPDSRARFRHDRDQRLAHDVVIVDETSMVSLPLMARLLEAIREDARVILVGDPEQLASIEAGAVLADIVGPAASRLLIAEPARALLAGLTGHALSSADPPGAVAIADAIVALERVHRFGGAIARLADAIRCGDGDAALAVLDEGPEELSWIELDSSEGASHESLAPVRDAALDAAQAMIAGARRGAGPEAIAALASFRILCAHRRGPQGVRTWNAQVERWLEAALEDFRADDRWYVGRPLLVDHNDYELQLYNGDTGVIVQAGPERLRAVFERRGGVLEFSPSRLTSTQTVYAMTIHKGQGSQFDTAAVLLPAPTSRILTRELLYTAVTRARRRLILVATEEAIRAAIARPVARASGLRERLWGD